MSEYDDIRDVFAQAAPEPRAELRGRTLEAMAEAGPVRPPSRSRVIAIATGIVTIAAMLGLDPFSAGMPPTQTGALAADYALAAAGGEGPAEAPRPADRGGPQSRTGESRLPLHLLPYGRRAVEFVQERYPNDPEMIMAAGLLAEDAGEGLRMLEKAAKTSGARAAWAAYVGRLTAEGPGYWRPGLSGADPEDREILAEEEARIHESGTPTRLTPEDAAPVLEALREWERADPTNGLPVALECWHLYGLGRDAEALERWDHAGTLPVMDEGLWATYQALARLFDRMGMSAARAVMATFSVSESLSSSGHLRAGARVAAYEGRAAQIEGRAGDAIRWWNGTIGIGRHMQDSADSIISFLVGVAVEAMGASKAWVWAPEWGSSRPTGPLLGGRYFRGPQYEFYVSQVGQPAADDLRDRLVRAKVRASLMREATKEGGFGYGFLRAFQVIALGVWIAGVAALALVIFLAVGTWRRRLADEASTLGRRWRAAIVLVTLAPVTVVVAAFWPFTEALSPREGPGGPALFVGGLGVAVLCAVVLPLVAARYTRRPSARLKTAWRGNLRETLPLTVALCGVLALGLGITSKGMQEKWARDWYRHGNTEMVQVVDRIGDEWRNPKIPADAWRDEQPPEPAR